MASKKKKKATSPVVKGAKIDHVLKDEIQEDLKKDLQKAFVDAFSKPIEDLDKNIYQAAKKEAFKQLYMPKQSGKTWASLQALHNEVYGKAAQMGSYTGENAKQHQWCTWMKQQMHKLHPYIMKAEIYKIEPWHAIRFEVVLTHQGMSQKVVQEASLELIHHVFQAHNEENLGHEILNDLKKKIENIAPSLPKGVPGNMTIAPVEGMFIVPKDMHAGFEEYAKAFKDSLTKGLAAKWLSDHKPPPKPIPTPPEKDKDYSLSPVVVYNDALKKIENHAKSVNASNIWGYIETAVSKHKKQEAAEYEAQLKKLHTQGFRGNVVQDSLKNVLPCLYEQVKCPKCGHRDNMADMIIHLNDGELWSREQIADWAESLDIDISVKETK